MSKLTFLLVVFRFYSVFVDLYCYLFVCFCSWQPESKFPFSQVFLPPKDTGKHIEFVETQEVEVFARSNEKEACGWWTANIKVLNFTHLLLYYIFTHEITTSLTNRSQLNSMEQ